MAITSKRETILEYLRNTTLPLINGTGDYNLTIKTISRELRIADSMKAFELPAIFILDDTVTVYTPMTDREMVTGQSIIDLTTGWPVVFACMVAKPKTSGLDKAGLLSTEMNKQNRL